MTDDQNTAPAPAEDLPPMRPDLDGAEEARVLSASSCYGAPAGFVAACGSAGPHGPH